MPASSHASRALSTASFTVVKSALAGLSKPSRCRFLVKNSLTEISRCFSARSAAVSRTIFLGSGLDGGGPAFFEADTAGDLRGTFFSCACAIGSPLQVRIVHLETAQNLTACRPMGQVLRRC